MTNLRVPLQRSDSDDRAQWQYPCDTKRLTSISARDSSHKYTSQGVKLLSSATTEKAAERGISRTFGSGNEPSTELKLGVAAQPARGYLPATTLSVARHRRRRRLTAAHLIVTLGAPPCTRGTHPRPPSRSPLRCAAAEERRAAWA